MSDPSLSGGLSGLPGLLVAGGPVVGLLLVLSVAALTIVLVKLWQYHAVGVDRRRAAGEALRMLAQGHEAAALERARAAGDPLSDLLARCLVGRRQGIAEARIRDEATRHGMAVVAALRGWLKPLEVIAALAPLLGLFGTVLGMIEAFRKLEGAGARVDPALLSGGIWEALLTTAVGLAVAMPTLAALSWLDRRVERLAGDMDDAVARVFGVDLTPAAPTRAPATRRAEEAARPHPAHALGG
ncbi:MotA/TolQ/ExbB proton channel family protein [Roseospirillum parvum]|uniref:Biopolymer transport protein ExbB n=1 Tax=Roseospirillum parvum TaxID=83401 RepID=A0A1G8AMZ5_9PROT|nr:MotA/TolQ/ExbB proton channel family protein [Roseospirillum parvum]SDH22136.1 biopolymer transport protein ExbB [Roseospirillum parvum]